MKIYSFLFLFALAPAINHGRSLPLEKVQLPPGFRISLYADDVPNARSMVLSPSGVLYVGTRKGGEVYALVDQDGDKRVDKKFTIASNLFAPNGVAFRDGALYVAEVNRVIKFSGIEKNLSRPPEPTVINDDYPSDTHHGWKFIAFGPDGKLYVPVGAPCNICLSENPIYASITRLNADGSGREIFAHGVRNTVGFDWHPETGEMWFTDNGRDWLGDNLPPDELNRAPEPGLHFGYPFLHGKDISDPKFGDQAPRRDFQPAAQELGPHVAALGVRFYTGDLFPSEYKNQIFIAEHGSWNRSTKIGYRVMLVRLEKGNPVSYETFASGWLEGTNVWGRPVDLLVMPDGSLLVSDDYAGAIYRITYEE